MDNKQRSILSIFRSIIRRIYYYWVFPFIRILVLLFPVKKDKIIFDNFCGKGYGDNPKYIAEEIIRQKLALKIIWVVSDMNEEFPVQIKKVKYGSIFSLYHWATASIWIDNVRNTLRTRKKKNQIYIQTWHSGWTYKMVEGEVEKQLNIKYVKAAKYDGKICDAILCADNAFYRVIKQYFWLSPATKILKCGLPRNDVLLNKKKIEEAKIKVKKFFNIKTKNKIILYAPTFRDNGSTEGYKIDFAEIINAFERKTNADCFIIIRLHPNAKSLCNFMQYSGKIINGTNYPDIQELLSASDYLISDYSTTAIDFVSLLRRPAFLCRIDYKEYMSCRNLKKDTFGFPFMYSESNKGLLNDIKCFDEHIFKKELDELFKKFYSYDKGNASRYVVEWIKKKR